MPALQSHNQIIDALARYPLIERVFKLSAERGVPIYLVGGTVRDLLIGQDIHDLDFAVYGSGLALARYIADQLDGYFVPLDRERHTGRVLLAHAHPPASALGKARFTSAPQHLDIASLRGDDLQADLEGRDFTLNAIAITQTDNGWRIDDPLEGHKDLSRGILRMASPSSFDSDPVRTLRAVRMQIQFGCILEPQTRNRLRQAVPLLERISAERVRDEWFKILQLSDAATALGEMAQLDLLHRVAPIITRAENLDHALATVGATEHLWNALCAPTDQPYSSPERLFAERVYKLGPHLRQRYTARICEERGYLALLKCAALLHSTRVSGAALAARWKLSKREAELLHTAIHHYADVRALTESTGPTRRAIYRFFVQTGEPGIDAAMLFLAHTLATSGVLGHRSNEWKHQTESVAQLLSAWFEHRDTQIAPTPLLSGTDIMQTFDLQTGPQIGKLLQRLAEEQAAGEIRTREQALACVQQWKIWDPDEGPTEERAKASDGE